MVGFPDFHLPEDGDERVWHRGIEHVPVGLGESPCDHEGGDIWMEIVDVGQAHVA
jgi:hypothetical protein